MGKIHTGGGAALWECHHRANQQAESSSVQAWGRQKSSPWRDEHQGQSRKSKHKKMSWRSWELQTSRALSWASKVVAKRPVEAWCGPQSCVVEATWQRLATTWPFWNRSLWSLEMDHPNKEKHLAGDSASLWRFWDGEFTWPEIKGWKGDLQLSRGSSLVTPWITWYKNSNFDELFFQTKKQVQHNATFGVTLIWIYPFFMKDLGIWFLVSCRFLEPPGSRVEDRMDCVLSFSKRGHEQNPLTFHESSWLFKFGIFISWLMK